MEPLTILYLFFILVTLYLNCLFMLIYFKNKDKMYKVDLIDKLPTLTVLIPAYNEEESIRKTVASIKKVKYPKRLLEIIVINDGSIDKTLEKIKNIKGIKILNKKNTGKADSINQGIKIAKGEIIATIDADCFPEKDSFIKMVSCFKDTKVGAVTASVLVKNKNNLLEKLQYIEYIFIAFGRKLLEFIDSVFVTSGALSMYKKEALITVGGFDKKNITEDIEIAWNLLSKQYSIKMCFAAKAYTIVPNKLKNWWMQRLRWDIGGFQTAIKYKSALLKKKYGLFGLFVVPLFTGYILLSFIGLATFTYVITQKIAIKSSYFYNSFINDVNFLRLESFLNITPNLFTFFGLFIIIITIIFLKEQFKTVNSQKKYISFDINTIFYLTIYLILFPLILLHSTYRLLIGKIQW